MIEGENVQQPGDSFDNEWSEYADPILEGDPTLRRKPVRDANTLEEAMRIISGLPLPEDSNTQPYAIEEGTLVSELEDRTQLPDQQSETIIIPNYLDLVGKKDEENSRPPHSSPRNNAS